MRAMPITSRSRSRLAWPGPAVTVLALSTVLAACGGDPGRPGSQVQDGKTTGVASMATGGSTPGPARTTTEERPLIRSDMSVDDYRRLRLPYDKCMETHGVDNTTKARAMKGYNRAQAACAGLEPEEVPDRAKRLDPTWPDKMRAWGQCLTAKGYKANFNSTRGILEWADPPNLNTDDQVHKKFDGTMHACQKQAFGD